jgi:hypothetical protein
MPSGWDVYYIVFLSALLALGIPLVLTFVSRIVSRAARKSSPDITGVASRSLPGALNDHLGQRMNARFFLGVNSTLALITLLLILIPCVGVIRNADGDREAALRSLFAVLSVAGFAGLGLLYCSRKGDLSWIRSFQKTPNEPAPESEKSE